MYVYIYIYIYVVRTGILMEVRQQCPETSETTRNVSKLNPQYSNANQYARVSSGNNAWCISVNPCAASSSRHVKLSGQEARTQKSLEAIKWHIR